MRRGVQAVERRTDVRPPRGADRRSQARSASASTSSADRCARASCPRSTGSILGPSARSQSRGPCWTLPAAASSQAPKAVVACSVSRGGQSSTVARILSQIGLLLPLPSSGDRRLGRRADPGEVIAAKPLAGGDPVERQPDSRRSRRFAGRRRDRQGRLEERATGVAHELARDLRSNKVRFP